MFVSPAGPSSLGAGINAKLSALVSAGYAGFLLMDVDWQATGSRSELWDRRQVFSKNRMGAQALSRAREELRPHGLSCLYRSGSGVLTKFTLRLRT